MPSIPSNAANNALVVTYKEAFLRDDKKLYIGTGADVALSWDNTNSRLLGPSPASGLWANCPYLSYPDKTTHYEYHEDFVGPYDTNDWVYYETDSAGDADNSIETSDALGGVLTMTPTDAADDRLLLIFVNEMFKVAAGKHLWFEARIKLTDATNQHCGVGLMVTEDITAVADNLPGNFIGFKKDGNTEWDFYTGDGADSGNDNEATADTNWVRLGFYINGATNVQPYIDGVAKTLVDSTNLYTAGEIAPYILTRNGDATADPLQVDYIRVVQLR